MDYLGAKAYILKRLEEELPPNLFYHGPHHTKDVLQATTELCNLEQIDPHHTTLLKTAALYHDAGFLYCMEGHEEASCHIVKQQLQHFQYKAEDIDAICGMIMATKIPQTPNDAYEAILCDADLDYLGREDFYPIAQSLFEELKAYEILTEESLWNKIQVDFLSKHRYFTATNRNRRIAKKSIFLEELKKIVAGHEKI